MTTPTGQLKSITTNAAHVRKLRNAALNIMEATRANHESYLNLGEQLTALNLELERGIGENQMNHLDRITMHLAVVEGELTKSELIQQTRDDATRMVTPAATKPSLNTERQVTRLGRAFQKLANAIG